jgi:hypothetical protein
MFQWSQRIRSVLVQQRGIIQSIQKIFVKVSQPCVLVPYKILRDLHPPEQHNLTGTVHRGVLHVPLWEFLHVFWDCLQIFVLRINHTVLVENFQDLVDQSRPTVHGNIFMKAFIQPSRVWVGMIVRILPEIH